MYTDVVDLRDFYETSLGQVAARMLRRRIRTIWPSLTGQSLAGLGYTVPYLRPYLGEAERVMSLMPAAQGVLPWPKEGPNVATLTEEAELPLQDASVDRLLLVHALECSEQVRPMLSEVWRVLAGGGRVLIVVPNRRGIWARLDRTPFGGGLGEHGLALVSGDLGCGVGRGDQADLRQVQALATGVAAAGVSAGCGRIARTKPSAA